MNIKRAILLVFSLRAAMLGIGCGRVGVGDHCNDHDGACSNSAPDCDEGLYCAQGGICAACTTNDCGPAAVGTAPTSTPPTSVGCSTILDAAACGRDDEALYCDPTGGGPELASDCRELGSSNTYCCPVSRPCEICDAGPDADDGSDASDADASVDTDN